MPKFKYVGDDVRDFPDFIRGAAEPGNEYELPYNVDPTRFEEVDSDKSKKATKE